MNLQAGEQPNLHIKPQFIGKFVNDKRRDSIITDDFEWRRLYEPNVRENVAFDLNRGFETFEHSPMYDGRIDSLLKFIMKNSKPGETLKQAVHDCDFVTSRGTLVKIGTFNSSNYFFEMKLYCRFYFCKFNGVIFACERLTEEQTLKNNTKKDKFTDYYGHKFEQYITVEPPKTEPTLNEPLSTLIAQEAVFKTQISSSRTCEINFLIKAEMDGVDKNKNFIEIKTMNNFIPKNRLYCPEPNWISVNKAKWWLQSVLVGVDRIFVGIRNQKKVVLSVKELNVQTIQNTGKEWEPQDCLKFLTDFYSEIRTLLDTKPEGTLLKVEFITEPYKKIVKTWVDNNERQKFEFLSDEFKQRFPI